MCVYAGIADLSGKGKWRRLMRNSAADGIVFLSPSFFLSHSCQNYRIVIMVSTSLFPSLLEVLLGVGGDIHIRKVVLSVRVMMILI